MRKSFSDSSRGFTLIELLVVLSVILLLSGLTLGGMRALRSHQVVKRAGARFEILLELGQALAMSEGESVYLVVADQGSEPEGVPMRAYTLIKGLTNPVLLHHWQFLPEKVVFARDNAASEVDLLAQGQDALAHLQTTDGNPEDFTPVVGPLRVLLELTSEGTFRSGPDRELQSASILLERGYWLTGGVYLSGLDNGEKVPLDAVRILFRPRSGVIRIEDKEELP